MPAALIAEARVSPVPNVLGISVMPPPLVHTNPRSGPSSCSTLPTTCPDELSPPANTSPLPRVLTISVPVPPDQKNARSLPSFPITAPLVLTAPAKEPDAANGLINVRPVKAIWA